MEEREREKDSRKEQGGWRNRKRKRHEEREKVGEVGGGMSKKSTWRSMKTEKESKEEEGEE